MSLSRLRQLAAIPEPIRPIHRETFSKAVRESVFMQSQVRPAHRIVMKTKNLKPYRRLSVIGFFWMFTLYWPAALNISFQQISGTNATETVDINYGNRKRVKPVESSSSSQDNLHEWAQGREARVVRPEVPASSSFAWFQHSFIFPYDMRNWSNRSVPPLCTNRNPLPSWIPLLFKSNTAKRFELTRPAQCCQATMTQMLLQEWTAFSS